MESHRLSRTDGSLALDSLYGDMTDRDLLGLVLTGLALMMFATGFVLVIY